MLTCKKCKWVWSGNTIIIHHRPTHGTVRKSHRTFTVARHPQSNQFSLPLWRWLQNKKEHKVIQRQSLTQNPHNRWEAHQTTCQQQQNHRLKMDTSLSQRGGGGLNAFYWYQLFGLDYVSVKTQNCYGMEALKLIQYIITENQSNQINTPWWKKEKGSWLTESQS